VILLRPTKSLALHLQQIGHYAHHRASNDAGNANAAILPAAFGE